MAWREDASFGRVRCDDLLVAGTPIQSGFGVFGDSIFVDYRNGSDGNSGKVRSRPCKTLGAAINTARTNNNDRIFIDGDSQVVETAMIDLSKNRVHIIGDCGPAWPFGYGAGARVGIGVTADTSDIALIKNTGVRNSFSNIKFVSDNDLTQAVYTVAEGGEYTRFFGCEFYKSTHLTTALAAEVLCNGDSAQFYGCTFGDLVNGKGGSSVPRANILVSRETITGKVARDVVFSRCRFLQKALHGDANFIYGAGATDVERTMEFWDCLFNNCILASATVADAITFGGAQTQGNVLLINPAGINVTAFAEASQNVFVVGAVPTAATTGIAVEVAA
jgi:hypothetical protein